MSNVEYARMKFYCDETLCIDCNGCVVACKEAHEVPVGVNRRKVVTINEGIVGKEVSVSMACMHCTDAPCQQVCPVDCFYIRTDGIVLHDKDKCIGCGYCLFACPFGAPQFPKDGAFGTKGKMDKCTMCAGGPEETNSKEEFEKYGQNRMAEGKVPMCASMCSTKALLVGDSHEVALIKTYRSVKKGQGISTDSYGW
ncbi:MAG: formate dehydrogenase FDH3 subunit beta [Arcobacteraceae bacterium]